MIHVLSGLIVLGFGVLVWRLFPAYPSLLGPYMELVEAFGVAYVLGWFLLRAVARWRP